MYSHLLHFCTFVNCLPSTNYSVDMRKYQCVTMVSHVAIVTANEIASLKETRMGVLHKKLLNDIYTLRM